MTTITVRCKNYPFGEQSVEVDAEVIGELAFHGPVDPMACDRTYTITHVRTGYMCFRARTKRQARAAIKALLKLPVDWSFDDPEVVRTWNHGKRISEIRDEALA